MLKEWMTKWYRATPSSPSPPFWFSGAYSKQLTWTSLQFYSWNNIPSWTTPTNVSTLWFFGLSKSHDNGQGKEVARSQVQVGVWGWVQRRSGYPGGHTSSWWWYHFLPAWETWGSLSLRPACGSGCWKHPFYITYTLGGSGDRTFAFQKLSRVNGFQKAMQRRLFLSSGAPKR